MAALPAVPAMTSKGKGQQQQEQQQQPQQPGEPPLTWPRLLRLYTQRGTAVMAPRGAKLQALRAVAAVAAAPAGVAAQQTRPSAGACERWQAGTLAGSRPSAPVCPSMC